MNTTLETHTSDYKHSTKHSTWITLVYEWHDVYVREDATYLGPPTTAWWSPYKPWHQT